MTDVDLAAERAASLERQEAKTWELMRATRARALRLEFDRWTDERRKARQKRPTLEEVAKYLWDHYDEERIADVCAAARDEIDRGRILSALTEGQTRDIIRRYLEDADEPTIVTAKEILEDVKRQGVPPWAESTLTNFIVPEERAKLGITYDRSAAVKASRAGAGAEPQADGDDGSTEELEEAEELPEDSDRNEPDEEDDGGWAEALDATRGTAAKVAERTMGRFAEAALEGEEEEATGDELPAHLRQLMEDPPEKFVGFDPARPGGECEAIVVQFNGSRLHAQRVGEPGGRWRLEFVGVVRGERVTELMEELLRAAGEVLEG